MIKNLKVQRHELKYYISRSDYEYMRYVLSELMIHDENQSSDRGYFIRSLYFDDVYETSVEDKLDGIEHRDKYRLRIYDIHQDWAKLERKRKMNNFVSKSSVLLKKKEALDIISGQHDSLLEKTGKTSKSIYFDFKKKYLRPVVIIDYVRDVFKLGYNEIRITFDKHIRINTTDLRLFEDIVTHPLQRDDVIIMEVKFNTCLPSWFRDFLTCESGVNQAISKYCYGRMDTQEYYSC